MRLVWTTIFGLIFLLGATGSWWVYQDTNKTRTLTVAAGPRGSDSHSLMEEISEVLVRHTDTLRLKVLESRNSSDNISLVNNGRVDLATVQANTPAYTTVSLVADLFPDYFMLIARSDRNLKNVADLRGKKIAIPEDGSSGSMSFWSIIDHYSLPPESMSALSIPREKGVRSFLSGEVDGIFLANSLRDPFLLLNLMEEARLRGIGLDFIPIEQAEAMALKRPYLEARTIVKGAFDGGLPMPKKDIVTPSVHRLLVAGSDVDEDAVHDFVKAIFENKLDLLIRMSLSAAITNPTDANGASLPIHPGAARFYDRDKPSFLQENAEPMALIVTIFAMMISAFVGLRRSLKARAKNRGDDYNDKLLDIAKRARLSNNKKDLVGMNTELVEVLEIVVHALDTDKITEEGFQSFAFLWGSTRDTVNEQLKSAK